MAIDPSRAITHYGIVASPGVFVCKRTLKGGRGEVVRWNEQSHSGWLVVAPTGLTYHSQAETADAAIRDALRGWNRQRKHARATARARAQAKLRTENLRKDFLGELEGRIIVLVWRSDSLEVGNCVPGTDAFRNRHSLRAVEPLDDRLIALALTEPRLMATIENALQHARDYVYGAVTA